MGRVERRIGEAVEYAQNRKCRDCECLQGFILRLRLDAKSEDVKKKLEELLSPRESVHSCLGCTPCPPAEAFSEYMRERKRRSSPDAGLG
ncbi:MAG: hypothetical protein ACE5Z5_09980 [Candidatus Bathyarchaeia archaeon]